jgi:HemY protein
MKKILLLVLLIAIIIAGLSAGPALVNYDGYFLIVLESGTFQLSIFGLVFSIAILFIGLWLLIILTRKLIRILSGSQDWLFSFSRRRKQKAFTLGLVSLAEGNYIEARKNLLRIKDEDFDGLNLLALAEAEAQLDNKTAAREYWYQASQETKTKLAGALCLIRDNLANEQSKQALTNINSLSDKLKRNTSVIKLWARALEMSGNYAELKSNLPGWKKALAEEYDYWLLQASKGEFAEIASREGANMLKQKWQELPRGSRKQVGQRAAYAKQLIDQSMYNDAEQVLVEGQKSGPVPALYNLFRELKNPNPTAAIKLLEKWLKSDDANVDLLSTLGELAFNSGDELLAEKVLSKAVKLDGQKRDVLLLAKIKEAQKDSVNALELYKKTMV